MPRSIDGPGGDTLDKSLTYLDSGAKFCDSFDVERTRSSIEFSAAHMVTDDPFFLANRNFIGLSICPSVSSRVI
jgi:hypothetical protein